VEKNNRTTLCLYYPKVTEELSIYLSHVLNLDSLEPQKNKK